MFGNHKPRITGTDEGIWRRIKLIPFEYKIPDEDLRDQSEMKEEFQKEFSGILNWAIDGYQKYKKKVLRNLSQLGMPQKNIKMIQTPLEDSWRNAVKNLI